MSVNTATSEALAEGLPVGQQAGSTRIHVLPIDHDHFRSYLLSD